MKKSLLFVIFMLVMGIAFTQNKVYVKAMDETRGEPISFALVQNRTLAQKVVSNEYGETRIVVNDSTLLKISAIGYHDYFQFIIKSEDVDTLEIYLKQKTYELSEFVVNPYPTVALFKKAIADLDLPDSNSVSANLFMVPNLKGYAEQAKNYQEGDVFTIGLGSPITSMYNLLSKRAKSERKLRKLQFADNRQEYISKRYNKQYVEQLLGIKKLKEIDAFMEYCQPSYDFILASTDYELACYVLNCYQSFLLNHTEIE